MHLAVNILDTHSVIRSWGVVGLCLFIFAETGLLIGFFLPGDTLLFLAGALTVSDANPHVPLGSLMIGTAIAAIAGAQLGWFFGAKAGPVLFDRPQSKLFNPHNVGRAHKLLERFHYGFAIVISRFIPVVRTFINPVCGVAEIPGKKFLVWNVIGGILWTQLLILLGRALGPAVHIDKYILPIVAAVVIISIGGILIEARRGGQRNKAEAAKAAAASENDAGSTAAG